jgi:hypothetical protein
VLARCNRRVGLENLLLLEKTLLSALAAAHGKYTLEIVLII